MVDINTSAILQLLDRLQKREQPISTMQGYGINDVEGDLGQEVSAIGRKAAVTGASAADPMSLTSAILGRLSPQMRDDWRAYRASEPDANLIGQLIGGGGAYGGMFKAVAGTLPRMAGSAGLVTGSDVIDGDVGTQTLAKALASQVGIAPMRAFLPMAAGAVASQVEMVPEAQAQTKRKAAPEAPAAPAVDYSKMEQAAESDPVLQGLLETIKAKDIESRSGVAGVNARSSDEVRRRASEEAATARQQFFARVQSLKDTGESELKGKATAAGQAVRDKAPSTFEDLQIPMPAWLGGGAIDAGRTFKNLQSFLPFVAGGVAGSMVGRSPIPARFKTWREALNVADDATVAPSARVAAQQTARDVKSVMDDTTMLGTVAPRMAGGAVVGSGAGLAGQMLPDFYDSKRLSTNPERDALMAEAGQYPEGHPERLRIEKMLENADRYPAMHPARTRAQENLAMPSTYINPALAGGLAGMSSATLRAGLPFATNDRALMNAQTERMGALKPKDVARESKRMGGIRDIDQSAAASRAAYDEQLRQLALQSAIDDAALASGQSAASRIGRQAASPELEDAIRALIEAQAKAQLGQTTQRALPPPNPPPSPAGGSSSQAPPPPIDPEIVRKAVADELKKQGSASRSRPLSKKAQEEQRLREEYEKMLAEDAKKPRKFSNLFKFPPHAGLPIAIGGPTLWDMMTSNR